MRTTHTYVTMEVPKELHDLVRANMEAAGYQHAINDEGEIDMHGIALVAEVDSRTESQRAAEGLVHALEAIERCEAISEDDFEPILERMKRVFDAV